MQTTKIKKNIIHSLLRYDLKSFIIKSFETLHPETEYIDNWHINVMCELFEKVANGEIKRLIINIPPRYMKSICGSIAFPAWFLGKHPDKKIITCSYSQMLSEKNALAHRNITNQEWYRDIFPNFEICKDQNTKNKFETTKYGFRLSSSIGGAITGEGADLIILDDPQNPGLIHCDYYRKYTINWFEKVLLTRLNNKKTGGIVIITNRLHQHDLSGYLVNKYKEKNWKILSLSAISIKKQQISRYIIRKNEILNPNRENTKDLEKIKREIGFVNFQTQYQQKPELTQNKYINIENINKYEFLPKENFKIIQSWDTAIKTGKNNDYSVCSTWMKFEEKFYLIDVFRKKMEYPELKTRIFDNFIKFNTSSILIEDKSSGQELLQELKNKLPIIAMKTGKITKLARFLRIIHLFEEKVFLPIKSPWIEKFLDELRDFPKTRYDDQIDSVSQYLNWEMDEKYKKYYNISRI